jgi:hypothetical protein
VGRGSRRAKNVSRGRPLITPIDLLGQNAAEPSSFDLRLENIPDAHRIVLVLECFAQRFRGTMTQPSGHSGRSKLNPALEKLITRGIWSRS